jgi:hypothetical protein
MPLRLSYKYQFNNFPIHSRAETQQGTQINENESGLNTLSITNIQSRDEDTLTLNWSFPLTAYSGEAQLRIPTTNRDPSGKGIEVQEVPNSNAPSEYPCSFTLWIDKDDTAPYSPSHNLESIISTTASFH